MMSPFSCDSRSTLSSSSTVNVSRDFCTPRSSTSSDRSTSSTSSNRDSVSSTLSTLSYLVPWIDTYSSSELPNLDLHRRTHSDGSSLSDSSEPPPKHNGKYIRPLPQIPAHARHSLPSIECSSPPSVSRPLRRLPIPPLRPGKFIAQSLAVPCR
ncbi:hypothetical protein HWV62_943 [Athelia sp. TMB]|nr:hypothetical protein HWV62_943 [Athelia sp. TMB]